MYRKIESMGARLLGLFVPSVDASAACQYYCWSACYQCPNYAPCCRLTSCSLSCQI
ncbi:hypothetical protein [Actinophytocola xinjiangensis]|uniref:hypothetical protein n=1 Tax=Actinophytocola xinjiangensis TaxID=485602 RepID=UPI000AC33A8E|nr:hypothetical protein [Actinophytocola xinjiangensis]